MTTSQSTPVSTAPIPDPQRPRRDAGRTRTRVLVVVALVLGVAVAEIGPARIAQALSAFLGAYIDAQQRMLAAAGNTTADGRSEFAVLLRDGETADGLRDALAAIDGVRFEREADLSGWVIVTTAAGNRAGLDALAALPQARLVVPNRGIWVCH